MKRLLLLITFILSVLYTSGQTVYPIRTYTVLNPPLPYTLSGFASEPGRMQLNVVVDDVSLDQYAVKFRITIQGNGIKLYTKPDLRQQPFFLDGGLTETVTGLDLEPLFNPDNLIFEGYSRNEYKRNGRLPEGVYRVWVDILDYYRSFQVSQSIPGIAMIYLTRAPRLSFPMSGSEIDPRTEPNLRFSWMGTLPADPLADIAYRFRLWEIRPQGRDPYEVARAMQPIFTEETTDPNFIYDMGLPPLIDGMNYAWQVEAIDREGRARFQNDGTSEVYTFRYGRSCITPEPVITSVGQTEVALRWSGDLSAQLYRISYKGSDESEWQHLETASITHTLKELKDNAGYEIKVQAICNDQEGDYSRIVRFKTNRIVDYTCGAAGDEFDLSNREPLASLGRFDEFKAADFVIEVEEAQGANGLFSGKGLALVPYLGFVKFMVTFENVFINTDRRMVDGQVQFVYDETTGMVFGFGMGGGKDADEAIDIVEEVAKVTDKVITTDGEVSDVTVSGNTVTITKKDGSTETVTVADGKKVAIVSPGGSSGGAVHVVDQASGRVFTTPKKKAGGKNGSSSVGTAATTGQYGCAIDFKPASTMRFGYDSVGDGKSKPDAYFNRNKSGDRIPWKSIQSGSTDFIDVVIKGDCHPDSLRYLRESGLITPSAPQDKGSRLMITGLADGEEDILTVAVAKTEHINDSTSREILTEAGALGLVAYDAISKNVVLVPINDAQCPTNPGIIKTELDKLFGPAVTSWQVTIRSNLNVEDLAPEGFKTSGNSFAARYTNDMKAVINKLKRQSDYDRKTLYLFFVNAPNADRAGYMPLAGDFGFIFNFGSNTNVIGHELAHGTFNLRHTFSDKAQHYLPEKSTKNLMDYANGTELWKYQWDLIHNPETILFDAFDESEGAYAEGEIAQKILQEFRCAYLDNINEFKSEYLSRLPVRDKVILAGQSFEICLEYDDEKKIYLTEDISLATGSYDKSSILDWTKTKVVPQNFTNKYIAGGLTVYTNTDDFASYLKPTDLSVQADFNKIWSEINVDDGIDSDEFIKLKSIAACATKHLTPQQRYDLLTKLAPVNKSIVETKEDLILDLFETSMHRDDLNEFVDLIKTDAQLFETLFAQLDDINYDFWSDENNKTRFLTTLYSIWNLSDESNLSNYTYGDENPLVYYYNAGGTFQRTFSIENDEFRFSGSDICSRKYIDDEGYTPDRCYNIFQPIRVIYDEEETINLPSKDVPAFYLMGVHDLEDLKARMTSLSIAMDVTLTVSAVGNLSKIKELPRAYRLVKVVIAGLEIGTSTLDMVLNYTSACEGNTEFCTKLKAYNFWLQMATLSSDIVVSKMANKAAKEALQVADDAVPDNIRRHLEDVAGVTTNSVSNIDDLLNKLHTQSLRDAFKTDFANFDNALKKAFYDKPELLNSWERVKNTTLRTDIKWLEFIEKGKIGQKNIPSGWKISEQGGVTSFRNTQGKLLAEFDGTTLKCSGGNKGKGWNTFLNIDPPMANAKYDVDGYIYETDELGRVVKVSGDLDDIVRARLNSQQIRSVDIKEGVKGTDQGGHAIAARFYGPGEQINYYPQAANLNQGEWKRMENLWAEAMVTKFDESGIIIKKGEDVKIQILPVFKGNGKRPVKFEVRYKIGNNDPVIETFDNQ